MKINIDQTKIMKISREKQDINIKIGNKQLKQVEEFKYLGKMLRYGNKNETEIGVRCSKACEIIGKINTSNKQRNPNRSKKSTAQHNLQTNIVLSITNVDIGFKNNPEN